MVMADPRRALAQALSDLKDAREPVDRAQALRVMGLAARELSDATQAARHLRGSIAVAARHGLDQLAGESRMSLALVLDDLGRPRAALQEIDRALALLKGLPKARARMQQGILLRRVGREAEALGAYGEALTSFRRHGDRLWQARALTNRGVLQAYRGALGQARADLNRAEGLYSELGLTAAVAQVQHNLGFVAAQGGHIVAALDWYDRADEHFQRSGGRPAVALIDRAELLLAARLLPEAMRAARDAVEAAVGARLGSLVPHARLLLAQAALAAGDLPTARVTARLAERAFRRQHRDRWAVLARYVASYHDTPARLRAVASSLEAAGWAEQALQAQLDAGVSNLDVKVRGPVRLRIRAWHAIALSRMHAGDARGAKRALRAGLELVDQYRATFGATELRVLSSAEGAGMAELGIRLAVRDGGPRQVLEWAERWRSASLRLPPPRDPSIVKELAQLRYVASELEGSAHSVRRAQLLRRQHALEETVRGRTWRSSGHGSTVDGGSVEEVLAALGERALLEIVEVDGRLVGVAAAGGRLRLAELGRTEVVARESAALSFAMRRLVLRHGSAASLAAASAAARHALGVLDGLLLAPVREWLGERELVVVPTGPLLALPWSALPGCGGERAVTVAPSAFAWWRAVERRASGDGRTVLVAAPRPAAAVDEVEALPGTQKILKGTVHSVLSAMEGASCAHIAAHGVFRSDNPLFSYLSMADGPLTVHDLTTLDTVPGLIVLSACDTGLSAVHPGDELMGLTAALLSAGTRTLIGSIGPVADTVTRELMIRLHRLLAQGIPPAAALAAARREADPHDWATAHSFTCFGGGR